MQLFLWFGSQLNILLGEAYASVKLSHPPPSPQSHISRRPALWKALGREVPMAQFQL